MDRRAFIGTFLNFLAAPPIAGAQPARKVQRIGLLWPLPEPPESHLYVKALRRGLAELGYVEGQTLAIEYVWSDATPAPWGALATELVRKRVEVIVVAGTHAALALKGATATMPIVLAAISDPVASGLVKSLARPGGNITGLSVFQAELQGKRLELVRELLPSLRRLATLVNPSNPASVPNVEALAAAAAAVNITLLRVAVQRSEAFDVAFSEMLKARPDGLIVPPDPLFLTHRATIIDFVAQHRLPTIYGVKDFVQAGGFLSYGVDLSAIFHRAAVYVDKILRGTRPADLPVEQPTKFELVINLETTKALGLTVSQSILIRADEIIQ